MPRPFSFKRTRKDIERKFSYQTILNGEMPSNYMKNISKFKRSKSKVTLQKHSPEPLFWC